jgi:hypothetical protein
MTKQFITIADTTINIQQIAFVERRRGSIEVFFSGQSEQGPLSISVLDPDAQILLDVLKSSE